MSDGPNCTHAPKMRIDNSFEHPHWKLWEHVLPNGVKLSELKNYFFFVLDNIELNFKQPVPGAVLPSTDVDVSYDLVMNTIPVSLTMTGVDIEALLNQYLGDFIQTILRQELPKEFTQVTFSVYDAGLTNNV